MIWTICRIEGFECFNTALESWNPDYMVHGHVHQSYGCDFQRERQHVCGTTIINACGYTQFELDQTHYPIRGWQAAWLNSQTMRRELKRHDAIESSTARTPW